MKLLKGKIEEQFHDIGLGSDFLETIPKAQMIKGKIDKMDFMKVFNIKTKMAIHRRGENVCKSYI